MNSSQYHSYIIYNSNIIVILIIISVQVRPLNLKQNNNYACSMYNFLCSDSLLYFFLFLSTLHSVYTRDCSCSVLYQLRMITCVHPGTTSPPICHYKIPHASNIAKENLH